MAVGAEYDVAVSFANEDRRYVEQVVRELERLGARVFYHPDRDVELWGKDRVAEFTDVFQHRSRSVVVFVSRHYANGDWTRVELRSALAHAIRVRHVYLLPARFDESPLPGLPDTVHHVDCNQTTPQQLARMVGAKLELRGAGAAEPSPPEPRAPVASPPAPDVAPHAPRAPGARTKTSLRARLKRVRTGGDIIAAGRDVYQFTLANSATARAITVALVAIALIVVIGVVVAPTLGQGGRKPTAITSPAIATTPTLGPSPGVTASPAVTPTPTPTPTLVPSPGALIAQLPKPPHRPWAATSISLTPLFARTPSTGFSAGGLPNGTAPWYVAWERGIVVQADGKDWVDTLARRGYATSSHPTVGAIVSWRAFATGYGSSGHVALVVDVDPTGQGFTVAEANVLGLGQVDVRWVPQSDPGIVGFVA